jgi:G:T/U-mismatch repair DNA glycosylase
LAALVLPSTSHTNAKFSLADLLANYAALRALAVADEAD